MTAPPRPLARHATRRTSHIAAIAALIVAAAVLAGCASETDDPSASTDTAQTGEAAYPLEVTVGDQQITLDEQPSKIVVLGPSITETVYAVGAGDQVLAVDTLSNYPADAAVSDLDAFSPSVESIIALDPDLVLLSNDTGEVVAGLEAVDITVVLLAAPQNLEGAYEQFEQIGALTGHPDQGEALAIDVQEGIEAAAATVPQTEPSPSYYWELDPTYFSVTSDTFIGDVVGQFGLTNIADQAPDTAGGYPQLSAEFIIDADPDMIFLADTVCCGQTAETVQAREGWDVTRAIKEGNIGVLNDDIASRWGPRLVELADEIAATIEMAAG